MEWNERAKTVFDVILNKTPKAMRPMMEIKTTKKAAQVAEKRGARSIELDDLVIACFEIIPAFAHKNLREDLKGAGVDISQYPQYGT